MADNDQSSAPPPNPFETNGNGTETTIEASDDGLTQNTPGVASKSGKTFIVLGAVGALMLFLIVNIFSGGDDSSKEPEEPKPVPIDTNRLPPPPPPVDEAITKPVAPPVVIPVIPEPVNITPLKPEDDSAAKAQAQARMRSAVILKDGGASAFGGLTGGDAGNSNNATAGDDPNSRFAANAGNTKVQRVKATSIGNLHRTIAQGRIIQATLESAINTDLPAPIRAIVSIDSYAEAGTEPLIPKGSRLIGVYNTTLTAGQTRVFVVWQRVIRPDGIDVMIGSPLVDAIGQGGVAGQVDTKFQEIFSRSLLSSIMNIATAMGADKIQGGSTTTTTGTTGSQTSGDTASVATTNALNRLGSVTDSFIQRFISVPPTILVDQGTKVNVMVNKDLIFPDDIAGVKIIN